MDFQTKECIVDAAKAYKAKHKLSDRKFAEWAKINYTYWNLVKNGSHTQRTGDGREVNIGDAFYRGLASAIDIAVDPVFWEHKDTPQYASAYATMVSTKKYCKTTTIIAASGAGKTYTKRRFITDNPDNVYAITVSSIHSLPDILGDICEALHLPYVCRKSSNLKAITEAFRQMKITGKTPLLIVDEVENLRVPAIGLFKALYDAIHEYCSMILIGTPQFTDKLRMLEAKNHSGVPQFVRRIEAGIVYLPEIDTRFDAFLSDIEDDRLKGILRSKCRNYGVLHDYLEPARREAAADGEPLTLEYMKLVSNI